jgi:hypothetical protein
VAAADMTTKVYVAKYVADPARWEPRNVGVLVDQGDKRAARFLGEDPSGKVDGNKVRHAVGAPADVYRSWIKHWRKALVDGDGDPDRADQRRDIDTFFIQQAGEVLVEAASRSLDQVVEAYFRRLVHQEDPRDLELRAAVEKVLSLAALTDKLDFERDVEVKAEPGKTNEIQETFRFDYGRRNGHLIVGQRVPLQIDAFVHDALYRYGRLPGDVRPVSFVQGFENEAKKPAVRNLEVWSTVVDVSAPDAAEDVVRAFEPA